VALPMVLHPTGYHLNQEQHWVALKDYYFPTPATEPESRSPAAGASQALSTLLTGQPGHSAAAHGFPWGSLPLLVIYFVSMFLATFFNVAFYSEIIAALDGRGVSFRRGLQAARSRLPSILAWSLLAGVAGWLIRTIEQRLPLAGRIVTGLIGMAWSIAAVFAIPVIIQQQPMRNPIRILQQSAATLKRPPLLLAGAAALIFKSVWLIVVAAVIWVLALLLMAYVSSVAGHVYRCALFKYATEGVVPEPYNQDLLDMAWKVKKSAQTQ